MFSKDYFLFFAKCTMFNNLILRNLLLFLIAYILKKQELKKVENMVILGQKKRGCLEINDSFPK